MKLLVPLTLFFQAGLLLAQEQISIIPQPSAPTVGTSNLPRRRVLEMPGNVATSEILPANYQVALLIKDKNDKGETSSDLAIVTASSRFILNASELRLSLDGVIKLDDDGSALVQYSLRWETPTGEANMIQILTSNAQGALHVRPGSDPEVIFRSASRTVSLSLIKLPPAKPR